MDCTPDVLGLLVDRPERFAPHLHLPLQHASDRMLQAMRRPYTAAAYARLVESVRAQVPHAAIGSDVIVGFPGETDEDAAALAAYLEASPLTHLHVFPYSDRPGTAAERLPGKVHGALVKARAQRLRAVSRVLSDGFRASQAGTVRPALTIDDGTTAVTDNYFKVPVPAGCTRNEWVQVTIPGGGV
jgi:threonylcarbamoyladenosine tRNA methylthiotransferase MtaB